jgi:uncharacterized membrane protein (DUF485 family)
MLYVDRCLKEFFNIPHIRNNILGKTALALLFFIACVILFGSSYVLMIHFDVAEHLSSMITFFILWIITPWPALIYSVKAQKVFDKHEESVKLPPKRVRTEETDETENLWEKVTKRIEEREQAKANPDLKNDHYDKP